MPKNSNVSLMRAGLTVQWRFYIIGKEMEGSESVGSMKDRFMVVFGEESDLNQPIQCSWYKTSEFSVVLSDDYFLFYFIFAQNAQEEFYRRAHTNVWCTRRKIFSSGYIKCNSVSCYTWTVNLKYSQSVFLPRSLKYNWVYPADYLVS